MACYMESPGKVEGSQMGTVDRQLSAGARAAFAEHSLVRLASGIELGDGRVLPAGAVGAVVGVWANGAAYEVEFSNTFHAVATIAGAKLAEAQTTSS